MMRQLSVVGLTLVALFAATNNSFAGVAGRSYKIDVEDGTKAGIAFDINGTDMLVHVPGADVEGSYTETPPGGLFSVVIGTSVSRDYLGFFVATQFEIPILVPSRLQGFGLGSTGFYQFKGAVKAP